jgi:hypothetical protein
MIREIGLGQVGKAFHILQKVNLVLSMSPQF